MPSGGETIRQPFAPAVDHPARSGHALGRKEEARGTFLRPLRPVLSIRLVEAGGDGTTDSELADDLESIRACNDFFNLELGMAVRHCKLAWVCADGRVFGPRELESLRAVLVGALAEHDQRLGVWRRLFEPLVDVSEEGFVCSKSLLAVSRDLCG